MEKGTFKIKCYGDKMESVTGHTEAYLGLHKTELCNYNITHIPTGMKFFDFACQKHARRFIKLVLATTFPFPMDGPDVSKISGFNGEILLNLKHQAEEI